MLTRVQKWGNSLALRIPKVFASGAKLTEESLVEISLVDGQIIIQPLPVQKWTLKQLLAGITNQNIHREIETGEAVGGEVW